MLSSKQLLAGAIGVLAAVLIGPAQVRAADPLSTIPAQVTAAVYIQEWGQIMWGLLVSQTGTQPSSYGDPVFNPDGSVSQSFIAPDGTIAIQTGFLDGSARIEITLPDGTSQTILQSVPVDFGHISTRGYHVTSSDGLAVDYTLVWDTRGTLDMSDDRQESSGSAVLPDGLTQVFSAVLDGGRVDLQSTQSDGSTFSMSVPMLAPNFIHPDFSQAAIGSYSDSNAALEFSLMWTPVYQSRWAALVMDLGEGLVGTYSLNADFSGTGQLEDSGELLALVSWTRLGEIHAYSLTGSNMQMSPTEAALDFLRHRWQTLSGLYGPGMSSSLMPNRPRWLFKMSRPRLLLRGTPGTVRATTRLVPLRLVRTQLAPGALTAAATARTKPAGR